MRTLQTRMFAGFMALAFFASACATQPFSANRNPAQQSSPLTHEQLEELESIGVGVMTLAMLSNRVGQEARIDSDLKTRLAQIGVNGEPRSGNASLIGVTTVFGLMGVGFVFQSAMAAQESLKLPQQLVKNFEMGGAVLILGSLLVGAGLSASESAGSSGSIHRKPLAKKATTEAERKREAAFKEFDRQIDLAADRYARIFGLDGTRRVILEEELRSAALAEGRKTSGTKDVSINIPRLMAESGLVGKDAHEDFLSIVENLQKATRSDGAVDRVANADRFEPNVKLAITTLQEYVAWLKQARAGLDADDVKVVDSELRRTDRLLARLKNLVS